MVEIVRGMVGEILAHLHSLQPFPSRDLVVGGAVANLVWNRLSGSSAPVNDIDIFRVRFVGKLTTYCQENNLPMPPADAWMWHTLRRSAGREKLLNFVDIITEQSSKQVAIDTCDLNCTMVGINLVTDELLYHEQFLRFLRTGRVEIVNYNSPAVSAIRLVAKVQELSAHAEYGHQFRCAARAMLARNEVEVFGDKYALKFEQHERVLGKYFDLDEYGSGWVLKPRFSHR